MHIMSFEEFLENGKPEMSVIIQRVADRYKKNYKNTLKRQHVPEYQYKNLCQKAWKVFRKTKDFDAAVKKEMMQGKESRKFFNPKYRKEAEALYDQYLEEMHARMEQERLKNAVLTAIPERIRDAYPATRQLKRRFVLRGPAEVPKCRGGSISGSFKAPGAGGIRDYKYVPSMFPADRRGRGHHARSHTYLRNHRDGRSFPSL